MKVRQSVPPSYRGWREVGGYQDKDALSPEDEMMDLLSKSTLLDQYVPSKFYGDWYHNAGLLAVGGIFSWLLGKFRFSIASLFFIVFMFSMFYRVSVRQYRSYLRDMAQREFSIQKIENDYETMDWLNTFMEKYWLYLEPSVSQIVCEQVNPILADSPAPAFVKLLWLDSFTAGTKPPRIDLVRTLPKTNDDVTVMDWGVSFTPNSLADATVKQRKSRVNERVVVKAKLFGLTIPILLEGLSFQVLVRVRVRMMGAFPHIQTVNVSLLEPPKYDFVAKLFSTALFNWEVLAIPGLLPFVNRMIVKYAGPMLIAPLSFQLNLQQLLAGNSVTGSVGVLVIRAIQASDLKGFETIDNTCDPYIEFSFAGKVQTRTKTIEDTIKPVWDEYVFLLVNNVAEPLCMRIFDWNYPKKDQNLGTILYDINHVLDEPKKSNISLPFLRNNKPVGNYKFDVDFLPALHGKKLIDGSFEPPPELNTGIVNLSIDEAKNLGDPEDKKFASFVEFYLDKELILSTSTVKGSTPSYGSNIEKIIENKGRSIAKVVVKNSKKEIIGYLVAKLSDLVDATNVDNMWHPLKKTEAELKITAKWKPVNIPYFDGASDYTEPIGVVRVYVDSASGLRNLETVGTIDPYVRLMINGFQAGRTMPQDSTLNPEYKETIYIPISSTNQKLTIELMDVERSQQDRTLGSFDVRLDELIEKKDGIFIPHVDEDMREGRLVSRKGPKGTVKYSLSFYPVKSVMDAKDILELDKLKKEEEEAKKAQDESKKPEKEEEMIEEQPKERLSLDELMSYKQGVLAYKIISADLGGQSGHVQFFFDQNAFPQFSSRRVSRKSKVNQSGDYTVKELEYSRVKIRVSSDLDGNILKKPILEISISTSELLKKCFLEPQVLKLKGASSASLEVQCSWYPMLMDSLPEQDSITNAGDLQVTVVSASDLPAGDSNGKSDPTAKLYLNNSSDSFMKTKTIKKTLNPTWNETTSIQIKSRYYSTLKIKVLDWDFGAGQDDTLCKLYFPLREIDPIKPSEFTVPLKDEKGSPAGEIVLRFQFKPDYVIDFTESSTRGVLDAGGKVIGVGGKVIEGGAGFAVKGVGAGVGLAGKGVGAGVGVAGKGLGAGVGAGGKVLGAGSSLVKGLTGRKKKDHDEQA